MKSRYKVRCEHYIYNPDIAVPKQCVRLASQFYQNMSYDNHSVYAFCKNHGGFLGLVKNWRWIPEEEYVIIKVYES
jgi:hypothetical protein